jgi:4-hydroxybenzoate polyprenyltransferase
MKFLKAINIVRPINLLILAFTQILCRLSITNVAFLENLGIQPMLSNSYFALLVLSTLLLAAGGYIINDIADIDIDTVNKPEKVIVNKYISEAMAMKLYMTFSFLGLLLGGILAWHVEMKQLVMLHVMMVAFLFFYANYLKSKLLIGNLVVAFCAAFSILIIIFFDLDHVHDMNEGQGLVYLGSYAALFCYSFFAFITTLMREIIKDMEDKIGDSDFDCKTVPIVWGDRIAKGIVTGLNLILLLVFSLFILLFVQNQYMKGLVVAVILLIPSLFFQYKLIVAKEKMDYSFLSIVLKVIMILGVSTLIPLQNGDAAMIFSSFFDLIGIQ